MIALLFETLGDAVVFQMGCLVAMAVCLGAFVSVIGACSAIALAMAVRAR